MEKHVFTVRVTMDTENSWSLKARGTKPLQQQPKFLLQPLILKHNPICWHGYRGLLCVLELFWYCRFWQMYTQIPQRHLPILVYELTLDRFIKSIIIQPFQKHYTTKATRILHFRLTCVSTAWLAKSISKSLT